MAGRMEVLPRLEHRLGEESRPLAPRRAKRSCNCPMTNSTADSGIRTPLIFSSKDCLKNRGRRDGKVGGSVEPVTNRTLTFTSSPSCKCSSSAKCSSFARRRGQLTELPRVTLLPTEKK